MFAWTHPSLAAARANKAPESDSRAAGWKRPGGPRARPGDPCRGRIARLPPPRRQPFRPCSRACARPRFTLALPSSRPSPARDAKPTAPSGPSALAALLRDGVAATAYGWTEARPGTRLREPAPGAADRGARGTRRRVRLGARSLRSPTAKCAPPAHDRPGLYDNILWHRRTATFLGGSFLTGGSPQLGPLRPLLIAPRRSYALRPPLHPLVPLPEKRRVGQQLDARALYLAPRARSWGALLLARFAA